MLKRKDQVVKASNDGVVYLFKKNKVAFFHGRGSFAKAGADGCEIAVAGAQNETLTAKNVMSQPDRCREPCRGRIRREADPQQRRGARHSGGAETPRCHRRGCDRTGNGQRLAEARL